MTYHESIEGRPRVITAKYGSCLFCKEGVTGKQVIYFPTLESVMCMKHRTSYVVIQEYDDGYQRVLALVSVKETKEEAKQEAQQLNHEAFIAKGGFGGRTYSSYTYKMITELVCFQERTAELDLDAGVEEEVT